MRDTQNVPYECATKHASLYECRHMICAVNQPHSTHAPNLYCNALPIPNDRPERVRSPGTLLQHTHVTSLSIKA